uniref:Uncharacterized protein n=1 Tax=Hyaloperonospora arabidopsidis (strain Emoy2) TaxID=559515 RepID=M4B3L8_HYAAE
MILKAYELCKCSGPAEIKPYSLTKPCTSSQRNHEIAAHEYLRPIMLRLLQNDRGHLVSTTPATVLSPSFEFVSDIRTVATRCLPRVPTHEQDTSSNPFYF